MTRYRHAVAAIRRTWETATSRKRPTRHLVSVNPWTEITLPPLDLAPRWRDVANDCFCLAGTVLVRLGFWLLERDQLADAFCPECGPTAADQDGECPGCGGTCFTPADARRWWA